MVVSILTYYIESYFSRRSDGSRLEDGRTDLVAVCRNAAGIWTVKRSALGDNKEIFDAELWGIYLAL